MIKKLTAKLLIAAGLRVGFIIGYLSETVVILAIHFGNILIELSIILELLC